MFLIGLRLIMLLAIAYLFGLLFAWLFWLFKGNNDGGDDFSDDKPDIPKPPSFGKPLEDKQVKKRLVEIDESYYLEEFDLSEKQ